MQIEFTETVPGKTLKDDAGYLIIDAWGGMYTATYDIRLHQFIAYIVPYKGHVDRHKAIVRNVPQVIFHYEIDNEKLKKLISE